MNFGERIQQIRKQNHLTQEQFAVQLHVTRQAISNWENNKNLPDIEMLLMISNQFDVSLDELIKGEEKITEKMIRDGSDTQRAKYFMISNLIGLAFCLFGVVILIINGATVSYLDVEGILHENFFLVFGGFSFLCVGLLIVFVGLFISLKQKKNYRRKLLQLGFMTTLVFFLLTLLIYSNGNRISYPSLFMAFVGLILMFCAIVRKSSGEK